MGSHLSELTLSHWGIQGFPLTSSYPRVFQVCPVSMVEAS